MVCQKTKSRTVLCFAGKCFIWDNKDKQHKFNTKAYKGVSIGYSTTRRVCRVYNRRTLVVEESVLAAFEESSFNHINVHNDEDATGDTLKNNQTAQRSSLKAAYRSDNPTDDVPRDWRLVHDHANDEILGNNIIYSVPSP